jgi:RluA family pseudouridine synthase
MTLYEDEELIFINKPPGRVSESFEEYFLVHRLDKETSGVLLLAKSPSMQKELEALFFEKGVEKEYLAICDKEVSLESWKVDNFLGKKVSYDGGVLFGSTSKEKGNKAVTFFEKVKSTPNASLILAKPVTGRTHQIRVHLKEKGHPILGDWQYEKKFQCPLHPPRLMLHALKLAFIHPRTKEKLSVTAPLFDDFLEVQKSLFGA